MIQPEELRIGNWVKPRFSAFKDSKYKIPDGKTIDLMKDAEPIPITPEWLERLGFINDSGDYYKDGFCIDTFSDSNHFWLLSSYEHHTKIEYIHQLQNLYFALTGKEL